MQDSRGASVTDARVWSRRRAVTVALAVAGVGLLADQLSKAWAVARLTPGEPRDFLGSLLRLHLVRNPGAAFSLGEGSTLIFTVLAVLALVVIIGWFLPRVRVRWWTAAVGLFIAGIAGNLIDRLGRPPAVGRGHVVDFLELPHWPIFNVADMCICSAAVLLVALTMFGHLGYDGTPRKDASKLDEPQDPQALAVSDQLHRGER